MLQETIGQELAELSRRYGAPIRRQATLINEGLFDPLGKPDRYGEVCMVVRRPDGRLLTARKTFYPPEAYRLLTGGIDHGESIFHALLRETEEETGLEVEVRRFLVDVSYATVRPDGKPMTRPGGSMFRSFAFLLDEVGGTLACYDPHEQVDDFRSVSVDELPNMADRLARLGQEFDPEIHGRWRDWGRFRAVIHRLVYEALTQQTSADGT